MTILDELQKYEDDMTLWRHELHKNPQTAYEETFAHDFIKARLEEWGIPYKTGYGTTGIVATIEGNTTSSGKRIGLRADMDALDLTEETGLPHASQNPGKMHACGHDGHTATLLGVAHYLNENKEFKGTAHLFFQPAEEGRQGSDAMIADGALKDHPVDYIFGYHNWPTLPFGHIATRTGPFMAAVDKLFITITGRGGHGAAPETTKDPVVIAAHLTLALQTIVSRNVPPSEQAVLSLCNIHGGLGAFNVIPDCVNMSGTIRTFTEDTRAFVARRIEDICRATGKAFDVRIEPRIENISPPTINHPDGIRLLRKALTHGGLGSEADYDLPSTTIGEDFGSFLQEVPGAFLFIGQQDEGQKDSPCNRGLHNPGYDFNDRLLPYAAATLAQIVKTYLQE